jgi:hypothetical protein
MSYLIIEFWIFFYFIIVYPIYIKRYGIKILKNMFLFQSFYQTNINMLIYYYYYYKINKNPIL